MITICFLTTPIISVLIGRYMANKKIWVKDAILEYGGDCLVIIFLMNFVLCLLNKDQFVEQFNSYPAFAIKFIGLLAILATVWGLLKGLVLTKRFKLIFDNSTKTLSEKTYRILFYSFAIAIALLNLIRIFGVTYSGDEAFSIMLAKITTSELIQATAYDVHPPLYYLFLRLAYILLGDHGYTYHLVSVIPVLIMIVFSITQVRKKYGDTTSILFIAIQTFLSSCFTHSLQIRMYSWANLFVFLCFWYGIELIEKRTGRLRWVQFTLFGILAAYTHYYALIAIALIHLVVYMVFMVREKRAFWKCFLSGITCVIAYIPWLKIFFDTFGRTSKSWWSTVIPSFKDCVLFMLGTDIFSKCLVAVFFFSIAFYLVNGLKEYKPFTLQKDAIHIDIAAIKRFLNKDEIVVAFSAAAVILCFIGLGIGISKLIRPLFLTRYTFMFVGILAICISIFAGKTFNSRKKATIIILFIFFIGAITWIRAFGLEAETNKTTIENVEYIKSHYKKGDMVVSNISPFNLSVFDYYFDFPHDEYTGFSDEFIGKNTWLIYRGELEDDFIAKIESNSGSITLMKSGQIALDGFDIYLVSFDGEGTQ